MKKTRVALLSGGVSSERAVSLESGNQVFAALDKQKYDIRRYDPQSDLPRLVAEAPGIDVALVILHGPFGEDGTVQGLLDLLGIPYQGSGVLGSAIAMNKLVSKQLYEKFGIPVPPYLALARHDRLDPEAISQRLGFPLVIKPVAGGSSIGMSIVKSPEALAAGVAQALQYDTGVLLEAYLAGVELTCGVIGNEHLEALPLIEIVPDKAHPFFDYTAKYTAGATQEICPARIDPALAEKAQSYGLMAHRALNCRGYSRTDMILKDGEIFVLETNTIPGMTPTSLMPQAARAAGMSFSQLLDRLIALALEDRPPRADRPV
jgi:D-alanine-D-alanine ligase